MDVNQGAVFDRSHLNRGSKTLIAQDLAVNVAQIGGKTLVELAMAYGVSRSRMRDALRAAARPLRRQHLAICVPIKDEGFVYVVTDDLSEYLLHFGHRLDPIVTELDRVDLDVKALNGGASMMTPVIDALYDFSDNAAQVILSGTP